MRLMEIIEERWERGNLPASQLIQIVRNFVGDKADITVLSKDQQRKTGETIKIDMLCHSFMTSFGSKRIVDEFLNREFEIQKKLNFMHSNRHMYTKEDFDQINKDEFNNKKLFHKIYKAAIQKVRNIVPHGWILTGNFESYDINSKMTFYIKRDLTAKLNKQDVYYHITKLSSLPTIKQNGLIVASNKRLNFDGYRNRIFLSTKFPDYDFVSHLITGSITAAAGDAEIAILKITLPETIDVYVDDQATDAAFVEQNIPPQNISVVYTGLLSQLPS